MEIYPTAEAGKTKPISCFVFRMWYIVCRVLKKQSQFAGWQIGVNSYLKGDYEKITLVGARKNKANQSQIK